MTLQSPAHTLQVSLGARAYAIAIGPGLLGNATLLSSCLAQPRVALVTNETLMPLYGNRLAQTFMDAGIAVVPIIIPDGEAYKNGATLNSIFDALLENRCDRQTTLIALGGGVIGDITGFAAATYQRGVPFIQIPTTLLAQVDSSVGGKTGINHPLGKNMIGAFYQPQLVLADTDTLATLPEREFRAGLAEVLKYGLAIDAAFFDWLETNLQALLKREGAALTYAISRSCEIKAGVVAADERETSREGGRALLNLGHTFGHAIESSMGYGVWLHGEAVGCGMALAAQFSKHLGMLDAASCDRAIRLIERAGLSSQLAATITAEEMLEHMARDKKNERGAIHLILLKHVGEAVVNGTVSAMQIRDFIRTSLSN